MANKITYDKWEIFCDSSYYHMWAVRPVGDRSSKSERLFHFATQKEAEEAKAILEKAI